MVITVVVTVVTGGVLYMDGEHATIHTCSTQEIQDYLQLNVGRQPRAV